MGGDPPGPHSVDAKKKESGASAVIYELRRLYRNLHVITRGTTKGFESLLTNFGLKVVRIDKRRLQGVSIPHDR